MYSEHIQRQAMYNNDEVNSIFFSHKNTEHIQSMIQHSVYTKSQRKHQISKQSDQELFIIMTSIYKQFAKNHPNYINEQVQELNTIVADEATKIIMPRLLQYLDYMNTLDKRLDVIDYGANTSNTGVKY